MKKFITIISILACSITSNAQQDPMLSQYMFNGLFLNPAYAGSHDYFSSTLLGRLQWMNFNGSPKTSLLAIDGPLREKTMGIGLIVANDNIGVTNQTDIYVNYSYNVRLGPGNLAFGLKAGTSHYKAKVSDLIIWDPEDPRFAGDIQTAFVPKFGFGMYYYTDKWYTGISIPALMAYDKNYTFNLNIDKSSDIRKHFYYTAGYVAEINERIKLKPSMLVKYQPAAPVEVDINLNVFYMDQIALGLSYRTQDAVVLMAEYQSNARFRVGYAYDITITPISNYSNGSHEVMIGYDFGKDIIATKTPRYF